MKHKQQQQQAHSYQIHIINIVPRVYKSFSVLDSFLSFSHTHSIAISSIGPHIRTTLGVHVLVHTHSLSHTLCITALQSYRTRSKMLLFLKCHQNEYTISLKSFKINRKTIFVIFQFTALKLHIFRDSMVRFVLRGCRASKERNFREYFIVADK